MFKHIECIVAIHIFKHIEYNMKTHNNKEKSILKFVRENKVITSSELARFLKMSWNTADKYLLELTLEGKIQRIKKQGVNLWMKK